MSECSDLELSKTFLSLVFIYKNQQMKTLTQDCKSKSFFYV